MITFNEFIIKIYKRILTQLGSSQSHDHIHTISELN
jgi:hypothetical protein